MIVTIRHGMILFLGQETRRPLDSTIPKAFTRTKDDSLLKHSFPLESIDKPRGFSGEISLIGIG